MKIPFVDLHAQYLTIKQAIDGAIAEVIAESAYIRGRHVDAFEQAWANALGVKHCVSCANGTDPVHIALGRLHVKAGDEHIALPLPCISMCDTVHEVGGRVRVC